MEEFGGRKEKVEILLIHYNLKNKICKRNDQKLERENRAGVMAQQSTAFTTT